jgi:hypothetical protein
MLVRPGKLNQRAVVEPSDPEGGESAERIHANWPGTAEHGPRPAHTTSRATPLAARGLRKAPRPAA